MALFQNADLFSDKIHQVSGVDAERMRQYKVWMTSGFQMEGIDAPLSVAWVVEEHLRTQEQDEFWVVTSNQYLQQPLTAEEMHELAHIRWDVENNGFKELNQKVKTKHIYSHDLNASSIIDSLHGL